MINWIMNKLGWVNAHQLTIADIYRVEQDKLIKQMQRDLNRFRSDAKAWESRFEQAASAFWLLTKAVREGTAIRIQPRWYRFGDMEDITVQIIEEPHNYVYNLNFRYTQKAVYAAPTVEEFAEQVGQRVKAEIIERAKSKM